MTQGQALHASRYPIALGGVVPTGPHVYVQTPNGAALSIYFNPPECE